VKSGPQNGVLSVIAIVLKGAAAAVRPL
jgi:hypothetical protein